MLAPTGTVFADDEDAEETVAEEAAEESTRSGGGAKVSVQEEEEKIDASADEINEYYQKIGEADGYAVWLRPEKYKDVIEERTAKQFKDEDKANDAAKALKDHFKNAELALIDTETDTVIAELEEIKKSKEEVIFYSRAERYLVYLNADRNKVLRIRYRVSTLDSEYLFLTKDQKTLELLSDDYKSVRAEMKLSEQDKEAAIYRSSDKQFWAMLSPDQDEAWACVKQAAENDHFRLYYDVDTAILALENKSNGYIWWSSPLNANRDTRATKLLVDDLQSSAVLTFGDRKSQSVTNLRSRTAADLSIKEEKNGITVTYSFSQCGVSIPVRYALEDDYLSVSTDTAQIKEGKSDEGKVASQLTLLGSFGAGASDEEGYFVIPDGSGALIRFNNGKSSTKSYSQKVYGRDITTVTTTKPAVTEKIYMPVYGIVKEGNAMAVIVEKGDGDVTLNASVSGQSLSSYNICSFNFLLRGSDTYIMAGNYGNLTVFEDGDIKNGEIRLRYYPIVKEDVSYADIAEVYRNYLLDDGGVKKIAEADTTELYLDLYGGCMKSRSVLGIPVTMKTSMTSYSEAKEIISGLTDSGVDDMAVVYHNWTNEGISGKVDNKAKPSGTLGGTSDFNKLVDYLEAQDIAFYPAVNNKTFKDGNGYYSFFDTTIRISNAYSKQMEYVLSYGVQDSSKKSVSLLSPGTFTELYAKLAGRYAAKGLTGISLGDMTSTVWGDYGKQNMGRDNTITALQESYQSLQNAGLSILADSCAAYTFPYAERISEVPLQSSGFDVFDEDIPFYQLVMHGVIPYSGTAINGSSDSANALLTSIATGCNPAYDMIYAQASDLKDTVFDKYYYSHYAFWSDTAAREYKLVRDVLSGVSDQIMTDYVRDGDISVTTYENGTEIIVDYEAQTVTVDGTVYVLEDYEKGE